MQEESLKKRLPTAIHPSDSHSEAVATPALDSSPRQAQMIALQRTLGNAATQRMVGGRETAHAHGRECGCLACKPRITQSNVRVTPFQQSATPDSAPQQSPANAPSSAHAEMSAGTDTIQRFFWDDEEEEPQQAPQPQQEDSGGGWFGGLFGNDEQTETPAPKNEYTGSVNNTPQNAPPAEKEESGWLGGWFDDDEEEQPKSAEKEEDDDGGLFGDWKWSDLNPFSDDSEEEEEAEEEDESSWWKDIWPFGKDKGDENAPDPDDPDAKPDDALDPPIGGSLPNTTAAKAGRAVGCLDGGPDSHNHDPGAPTDFDTLAKTMNAQVAPPGAGMYRTAKLNAKGRSEVDVVQGSGVVPSSEAWAMEKLNPSIGLDESVQHDDSVATPFGTTDGTYQMTGRQWTWNDSSKTVDFVNTVKHIIRWGIKGGNATAANSAEDSTITENTYLSAINAFDSTANGNAAGAAFWSPSLTTRHEMVHVRQMTGRSAQDILKLWEMLEGVTITGIPWLWWSDSDRANVSAQVDKHVTAIFGKWCAEVYSDYNKNCEPPAYADGKAPYIELADKIAARAKKEKWKYANDLK
jgi:hypothetical protein